MSRRLAGAMATHGNSSGRKPPFPSASVAWWNMSAAGRYRRAALVSRRDDPRYHAYDTPVTGWRGRHVNTLRLWSARSAHRSSAQSIRPGNDTDAAEAICDHSIRATSRRREKNSGFGRNIFSPPLRCKTSCDVTCGGREPRFVPAKAAIQLNDTHPALAVAELIRILVDEHEFSWSAPGRLPVDR